MNQAVSGLRVLVVDHAPPVDPTDGSALIALHLFPRLRANRLTLLAPSVGPALAPHALDDLFDEVHLVPISARVPAVRGWLSSTISGWPLTYRFGASDASNMRARLREILATQRFDLIHVRRLSMAPLVVQTGARPRLLELVDSLALAAERAGSEPRMRLRARVARHLETRTIPRFNVVTTVSNIDAQHLRTLSPRARVEVIENGVDATYFAPPQNAPQQAGIIFVGTLQYPPNVDAVTFLARDILPVVRTVVPGLRVRVVGRSPGRDLIALARAHDIEVVPDPPDVRPYLAEAAVVVCPMVSGSGLKNKVLEAMAMAKAIVATSVAAEALEVEDGVHLVVRDDPAMFAKELLRLLADPDERARVGAAARTLIEARYTWDRTAERYASVYRELSARPIL